MSALPSQDEIIAKLFTLLPRSRFRHVMGVANLCAAIAMANGKEDIERYVVAGLLHDCAKYMTQEELISFAKEHSIDIRSCLPDYRFNLHAVVGAFIARTEYGVEDEEILDAIFYHTTGRLSMTFLEKCIYLADYLEPGREYTTIPSLVELRKMVFEDIEKTMYYVLKNTVSRIKSIRGGIDPITETIYQEYCAKGFGE